MLDLTLPGYKYLGPGNSLDKGEPSSSADAAARVHDIEYTDALSLGNNPYTHFNAADQALIDATSSDSSVGGSLANLYFRSKRLLAPDMAPAAKRPHVDDGASSSQSDGLAVTMGEFAGGQGGNAAGNMSASSGGSTSTTTTPSLLPKRTVEGNVETFTFSNTRRWNWNSLPSMPKITHIGVIPSSVVPARPTGAWPITNTLIAYPWSVIPTNNLGLYMNMSQSAMVFGRPGITRWRVKHVEITGFQSRMAMKEPVTLTDRLVVDKPYWMSFIDRHNLFWQQSSVAGASAYLNDAMNPSWSPNSRQVIQEQRPLPQPSSVSISLNVLQDIYPSTYITVDTVDGGTGTVDTDLNAAVPYIFKDIESFGEVNYHEPGASIHYSEDVPMEMIDYALGGFDSSGWASQKGPNVSAPVGYYMPDNNQWSGLNFIFPGVGYKALDGVQGRYNNQLHNVSDIPMWLVRVPMVVGPEGSIIDSRVDMVFTYTVTIEAEYSTPINAGIYGGGDIIRMGRLQHKANQFNLWNAIGHSVGGTILQQYSPSGVHVDQNAPIVH